MELGRWSFVRVDTDCAVPLEILKETPEQGLQFELQSKSLRRMHRYTSGRPTPAAPLEQSPPSVQAYTEMEEVRKGFR